MRNNKIYILGAAATNDRLWAYIRPARGLGIGIKGLIEQNYIKLHNKDTAHNIFNGMETFIALRSSGALKEILQDV